MNFKLHDSLGFILNKVNTKLKNELLQRLKEDDVTPEQWAVLKALAEQEGLSPKELSDVTAKDKPNTCRILDKLAAKKLIVRNAHPSDKRSSRIDLTPLGNELLERLIPNVQATLTKVTTGMDAADIENLKRLLQKLYANCN